MKRLPSQMRDYPNTQALLLKTLIFCIFFTVAAISIAILLPNNQKLEQPTTITSADIEQNDFFVSLETDLSEETYPLSGIVLQHSNANDKGLELYRNAHTKAAVEWFYLHITGNRDVTQAILKEANKNDISLSLAFALAYVESRYKPNAVNKNTNESIDRGLFQLNSSSFPKLTESEFFNPEISAKYGMQHLRFCIDLGGKEVTALAMYNAGTTRVRNNNTPKTTLNYVDMIMKYRAGLETAFNDEVVALYTPIEVPTTRLAMLSGF